MKIILAVFDEKAGLFFPPFTAAALGVCYRNLADVVAQKADKDNVLAQHPEDFSLFRLGDWDEESGCIIAESVPKLVCRLVDLEVKLGD